MTKEIVVSREFIMAGRTGPGGWKREQFEILGISYPPYKGWQQDVIGSMITMDEAERFLQLKGSNNSSNDMVSISITREEYHLLIAVLERITGQYNPSR